VTTRNRRKSDRLAFAYDDLEARIAAIAEAEGLAAVRPDLDGEAIMRILDIRPGREVGEAYRFLLELRLDEGPLGEAEAEQRLRDWWRGGAMRNRASNSATPAPREPATEYPSS